MAISHLQLTWANKPGCRLAVAEFWRAEDDLWLTIFLNDKDKDNTLRIEVLPSVAERKTHLLDFAELEQKIEHAKRELLAMVTSGEN
jgi:hypothetical protein